VELVILLTILLESNSGDASRIATWFMLLINVCESLGETIRLLFKVAQVPFEDIRLDEEGILRLADGQDYKIGTMTEKYSSRRLTKLQTF
jgi:hypothetical protein